MTSAYIRKSALLATLLMAAVFTAAAQSGSGFPMVGIASGQSARINAWNGAPADPSGLTSCSVTMQFVDTNGKVLKQTVINLRPETASSLDLSWDELSTADLRVQVRAVLLYGYSGGANPPPMLLQQSACANLAPSLEVYDNTNGRTSFILTDAKALPPPLVPAQ
jgi:hypothetical protein